MWASTIIVRIEEETLADPTEKALLFPLQTVKQLMEKVEHLQVRPEKIVCKKPKWVSQQSIQRETIVLLAKGEGNFQGYSCPTCSCKDIEYKSWSLFSYMFVPKPDLDIRWVEKITVVVMIRTS